MAIVDSILSSLNSAELSEFAEKLGVDHEKMYAAIKDVIPTLLTGLHANIQSDDGATALSSALNAHREANPLGNLDDLISGQLGTGIVGHILGGNAGNVAGAIARKNGLDVGTVQKLLAIVAPLVMSFLAKDVASGASLRESVESETATAHDSKPDIGGVIGGLIGAA